MLTGRNQHRVGFGIVAEFSGPFPGYNATIPRDCATAAEDPAGERLHDRRDREVAPDAGQPAGLERPVQPLADRARVRLLLGLPRRRGGPVRPAHHREPEGPAASPRARTASPTTSRTTWPTRRSTGCTACAPRSRKRPWFMYYATGCSHAPHHVPREWSDKYQGKFDEGWDVAARGDVRAPEGARRRPRRHGAAGERRVPDLGLPDRDARSASTRARWRSTPATPRTPTGTSAGSSPRSRRWASSTTPS